MTAAELICQVLNIEDEDYLGDNKMVADGIYDVSDIPFIHIRRSLHGKLAERDNEPDIRAFVEQHRETFVIGHAYETNSTFLLARKPGKANIQQHGGGFEGHGTSALLDLTASPTPVTKLLILGEND